MPADKQYEVMPGGKCAHVGHSVGYLPAYRVKAAKRCRWRYVPLDVVYDAMELVERLCCLRIKVYVAVEVELHHIVESLYHYGLALCLPHQPQHLGVAVLAEYHNLRVGVGVKLPLYPALQLQHHRACGVYYLDIVAPRQLVGLGRFAVSAQQYLGVVQPAQVFVVYGHEAHPAQPLALHAVVYYVAEAIERLATGQLFLGFLYGSGHAEAKSAAIVYFYLHLSYVVLVVKQCVPHRQSHARDSAHV